MISFIYHLNDLSPWCHFCLTTYLHYINCKLDTLAYLNIFYSYSWWFSFVYYLSNYSKKADIREIKCIILYKLVKLFILTRIQTFQKNPTEIYDHFLPNNFLNSHLYSWVLFFPKPDKIFESKNQPTNHSTNQMTYSANNHK